MSFNESVENAFTSESASYDELELFAWYTYQSGRKQKIVNRNHEKILANGEVFGLRPIRGGNYYIIFPDLYHVNFTIDHTVGAKLISNSDKLRRAPNIQNKKVDGGRIKVANVQSDNRAWDAPYFKAARVVKNEKTDGIDYANYQWRKVGDPVGFILKKADRKKHYTKNSVFGIRWLKPAQGGVVVDQDFNRFAVSKDLYDKILAASTVQRKNLWPEGGFTVEDMMDSDHERKLKEKEERAAAARELRARQQKIREQKAAEEKARKAEEAAKRKQEIIDAEDNAKTVGELMAKIRKEKMIPMSDEEVRKTIKTIKLKRAEDLGLRDEHLAPHEDHSLDIDLDNLEIDSDFKHDSAKSDITKPSDPVALIKTAVEDLKRNTATPKFQDLDDEPEEEEESSPPVKINPKDFSSDEEEEEDLDDIELTDVDDDEEDFSDFDEKPVAKFPKRNEVSEPDPVDDESLEDDEDLSAAEEEEEELDEEEEEPEAKPVVKKSFEEGSVIVFNADTTEKREFAIVDIVPFKNNDNILIYKLYDTTNEPEEYRTVRIDKTQRRTIEDMAEYVRKLPVRDVIGLQSEIEIYDLNKEPIVS